MDALQLSDGEWILVTLAVLYFFESGVWIPRGAVLLATNFLGRKMQPREGIWFANERGGIHLLPLTPWSWGVISQLWPVSLAPRGAYAYVAQSLDDKIRFAHENVFWEWSVIEKVESTGHEVRVNGQKFVKVCSTVLAQRLLTDLRRIGKKPEAKRPAAIDKVLQQITDSELVKQRLAAALDLAAWVSAPAKGLWLTSFVIIPLKLWLPLDGRIPPPPTWWVLMLFFSFWIWSVVAYALCMRRLRRKLELPALKSHTWSLLLSPASAMRAQDRLVREVVADCHPLSVAAVTTAPEVFSAFTRRMLRDLWHPLQPVCASNDEAAQEAEAWFRYRLSETLEQRATEAGVPLADVKEPPIADGADARTFCPRCEMQFVTESGVCTDCGGIALQSFESEQQPEPGPVESC